MVQVKRALSKKETTLQELVDLCWILRQASKLADDLRKEVNKIDNLIAIVVANRWLMQPTHGPIRGELATGTPDVRDQPVIPSRSDNPEQYDALLRELGIPESLIATQTMRIDYDGIGNLLAAMHADGKPTPEFLKKAGTAYTRATLRLTTKRGNPFDSEGSKNDDIVMEE